VGRSGAITDCSDADALSRQTMPGATLTLGHVMYVVSTFRHRSRSVRRRSLSRESSCTSQAPAASSVSVHLRSCLRTIRSRRNRSAVVTGGEIDPKRPSGMEIALRCDDVYRRMLAPLLPAQWSLPLPKSRRAGRWSRSFAVRMACSSNSARQFSKTDELQSSESSCVNSPGESGFAPR
jgi:hypothetical protein